MNQTKRTNKPYRITVQGRSRREDYAFATREEFDKFFKDNERYVLNYSTPN